jgi:hypothetical protein
MLIRRLAETSHMQSIKPLYVRRFVPQRDAFYNPKP